MILRGLRDIALCALVFASSLTSRAQGVEAGVPSVVDTLRSRYNAYSAWCSPEKVYLHFDRSCYTAGETIWLKGWTQEASQLSTLTPSNFMYAEVLDAGGDAVVRVKIKRGGAGFPGRIELPDNLETGDYTIRAYTLWQLNNPEEYLFNDRIRIIGGKGTKDKKPAAPSDDIEVSFWPEGGRYFAGQRSVIGFKAVDKLGRSVELAGTLVSDAGEAVVSVSTSHDGMGAFTFVPEAGRRYSIRDAFGRAHPLPPASEDGATLQLKSAADSYYIGALGYGGGVASLLVRDASELYPVADISLDGQMRSVILDSPSFRPGINHLLLVDSHGKILSERLFFVRDGEAPACKFELDRFPSDRRALAGGTIYLTDPQGRPIDGNCSVSIVRGALQNWQQADGITSYMGLSSELKGRINEPFYYFDPEIPEPERDAALDLLMMIQGWRYYDLEQITDLPGGHISLRHMRELMQEIRVTISRLVSSRTPRNFTFIFMVPSQDHVQSVEVEKGKDFIIDSLDFKEGTEMLINIGSSRLGAPYLPVWSGDPSAPSFVYKPAPGLAGSRMVEIPMLDTSAQGDTLQAAVVTASYPDDDVLFYGRSLREDLAIYKDMTLVEYLSMRKAVFEYDGENMYNRNMRRSGALVEDEEMAFGEDDDESGKVKLIVDDTEDVWWGYDMLRLEDLRSLSVSTHPDPVFGGDGGVVHISLKPGTVRRTGPRSPSLLYFVPLGYQEPRYFESPRYDMGWDMPYDARNTIYWSPDMPVVGGRAALEFCNNDLQDYPYIVRIEGVASDGRPFSRHCTISPE